MKRTALAVTVVALSLGVAQGQDLWQNMQRQQAKAAAGIQRKPRVFIEGRGTTNVSADRHEANLDRHDEPMEIMRTLQHCGVTITLNRSDADYLVLVNRESKRKRTIFRTNNQVAIATASGEVLGVWDRQLISTDAHDSCKVVTQDWDEKAPLRAAK